MEVVIALILIMAAIAFHWLLMPYLLMIALGALGFEFPFIVCMAFWVIASALFKKLRPNIVNKTE